MNIPKIEIISYIYIFIINIYTIKIIFNLGKNSSVFKI